ncbi:MAG TPA: LemA family protein [Candidatus Nanoarchaeia archaeon]|nr:LemA family protein [Candidatus Nanoarchaeia archaeon]
MAIGALIVVLAIIVLIVIILVGWYIGTYNAFIALKADIPKAMGNIDVLLKQRSDELPKLVASVKGYMKHEKGTLEELTKARTSWMKAGSLAEKAKASDRISAALKTIFAVAENYPKLEASANFQQLQGRISGLENEIADRREFYNDSVTTFNVRIRQFPANIVARNMGLTQEFELFKATESERADVKIEF